MIHSDSKENFQYMTGSILLLGKISNFTLLLLNGTGWYQVNFTYAEPLIWGKGKGCGFIYGDCVDESTELGKFEEFCYESPNQDIQSPITRCTQDRKFISACFIVSGIPEYPVWDYFGIIGITFDPTSDNCPYPYFIPGLNQPMCSNGQSQSILVDEVYGNDSLCFEGSLVKNTTDFYATVVENDLILESAYCLNYQVNKNRWFSD